MYRMFNKPQEEMTATPCKYPQGRFQDKQCRECLSLFSPKAPSHLYCSQSCAKDALQSRYLERTYGMTLKDYIALLEFQENACAICGGEGFTMTDCHLVKLVVDHCHSSGKIRGLLCHNCNRALGLLQDSREFLLNAVEYLEGATTIPKGSTLKRAEAHSPSDG